MRNLSELQNNQRETYNHLLKYDIPEMIKDIGSFDYGNHSVRSRIFPVALDSYITDDKGTDYYPLRMESKVTDNSTGEHIEFNIDLLNIPVMHELGFMIRGNYMQQLDSYSRATGWTFSRKMDNKKGTYSYSAKALGLRGASFGFVYSPEKGANVELTNMQTRKKILVPVSIFFRAISGQTNLELLTKFGIENPHVVEAFSGRNVEELTRNECISKVAEALSETNKGEETKTIQLKLSSIRKMLYSKRFINLGHYNRERFVTTQSFAHRAKGKVLAEKLELSDRTLEKGTVLDTDVLEVIDALPITTLKVEYEGRTYSLRKFSNYTFSVLGYTLAEDVSKLGLAKNKVLDLSDIKMLNKSDLTQIKVCKAKNDPVEVVARRADASTLQLNDFYTIFSMWMDNINGFNLIDSEYELTNRIVIPFDHSIMQMMEHNLTTVHDKIVQDLHNLQGSINNIIRDYGLDLNQFIDSVRDTKNNDGQIAEMCNIIAFTSKSGKISTDIDPNNTSTAMISVQDTQEGRLDAFDVPESSKIGVVHNKTVLCDTDESGSLVTPYLEVKNGKVVSTEPVYLTAAEELGKNIATFDESFVNDDGTPKDKIRVRSGGDDKLVSPDQVNYKEYSCIQGMSPAHCLITFPGHSNGKRITMACNQARQSLAAYGNSRPLVGTGCESIIDIGTYTAKHVLQMYFNSYKDYYNIVAKNKDRIMNSSIQLFGLRDLNGKRELMFYVNEVLKINEENGTDYVATINLVVPYHLRNFQEGMFTFRINHKPNGLYECNDVICYNDGYSLKGSDRKDLLDFGQLDIKGKDLNRGLALGVNLPVVYKTYGSSSIEDAITISDDVVYEDTLSHTRVILYEETLHESSDYVERFGVADPTDCGYFSINGLPKIGTKLKQGDPIISKVSTSVLGNVRSMKFVRLSAFDEGQVIRAEITKKSNGEEVARVLIAYRASITNGDKLAGRHGNKGVVARIVPAEDMPYDPITGLRAKIILSPLGIPSRLNISQLLEDSLGLCCLLGNFQSYVSPYHKDDLKFVKEMVDKFEAHPRTMIDGRTGRPFPRKLNFGVIYMQKLHHIASNKIHAIGMDAPVDPVFLQPKKGSKMNGGQSFGEMENWCLHAAGCKYIIDDLYGFQSDDPIARDAVKKTIASGRTTVDTVSQKNNNTASMQAFMRVMGAEIEIDSLTGDVSLVPFTDERIRALSIQPINTKSGLHSSRVFGKSDSIAEKSRGKYAWGWIDLHTQIVHPEWVIKGGFFKALKLYNPIEDKVRSFGTETIEAIIRGDYQISCGEGINDFYWYTSQETANMNTLRKDNLITGMPAVIKIIKTLDVSNLVSIAKADVEKFLTNHTESRTVIVNGEPVTQDVVPDEVYEDPNYLTKITRLSNLEDFVSAGLKPTDFIISSFPVLPQTFRPVIDVAHLKNSKADFDQFYEQIISASNAVAENKNLNSEANLYFRIKEFVSSGKDSMNKKSKKKFKNIQEYFAGVNDSKNHGKMRQAVQSKRVFCSGRAVITPARESIDIMHLGVPVTMIVKMYEEQLRAYFLEKRNDQSISIKPGVLKKLLLALSIDSFFMFEKEYEKPKYSLSSAFGMQTRTAFKKMKQWLIDFCEVGSDGEPQVVLAGRQPSLHRYSIRAFYPVPLWSKAIEINSLVCKGFNADFDGDQMWLTAMISKAAQKEAIDRLSPKTDFINPKDDQIILEHSQDIALGCYCATMLENNAEVCNKTLADVHYYSTQTAIESDIDLGVLSPYDLVCLSVDLGEDDLVHYLSTAGRIMFNSIFSDGLTDRPFSNPLKIAGVRDERLRDLKYDGIVTCGKGGDGPVKYFKLKQICKDAFAENSPEDCLDIFYEIQKFGFKFSDYYGVSISIDDMDLKSNKDEILAKAEEKKSLIEQDYQDGLISEEDKINAVLGLYNNTGSSSEEIGALELIQKDVIDSLDRNNNLFIMMDSGARGNKTQIMHMCGAIGILEKTKDSSMNEPLVHNYYEGLNSLDVKMTSYSSRTGVASTQRETRNAGYCTRKTVYVTDGITVSEEDCGKKDWWYDIEWGDRISGLSVFIPSRAWFEVHLVGTTLENDYTPGNLSKGTLITSEMFDLFAEGFNSITVSNNAGRIISFDADPSLLKGYSVLESDTENYKLFRQLHNENGVLDVRCISAFDDYKVKQIETTAGTLICRYHISDHCRNQLMYREARGDLPLWTTKDKTFGKPISVITKKTLDYIEKQGIDTIQARVMLDCKAKGGICAHCYGLKFTDYQLPAIGTLVGTESAQAIGEPATQLTMNVINKGGAAGSSISSGVDVFQSYLGGGLPGGKDATHADVVSYSGYIHKDTSSSALTSLIVEPFDKSCHMCEVCKAKAKAHTGAAICPYANHLTMADPMCALPQKVPTADVKVGEGEFVYSGCPITNYTMISDNVVSYKDSTDPAIVLRRKQMIWIKNYYDIFHSASIDINVRHFELLVFAQNRFGVVVKSDNPQYQPGKLYNINELLDAGDDVKFVMHTLKIHESVTNNSGILAALTFNDVADKIAKFTERHVVTNLKSSSSPIGNISIGQQFTKKGFVQISNPKLATPVYNSVQTNNSNENSVNLLDLDITSGTSSMNAFDDMFGSEDDFFSFDESITEEATAESVTASVTEGATVEMDTFSTEDAASKDIEEDFNEFDKEEQNLLDSDVKDYTVKYIVDDSPAAYLTELKRGTVGDIIIPRHVPNAKLDGPSELILDRFADTYTFNFVSITSQSLSDFDDFDDNDDFSSDDLFTDDKDDSSVDDSKKENSPNTEAMSLF